MEVEKNEPLLRFARQHFWLSTVNKDSIDLAGVVPSDDLKIVILFNSGRVIVLDLSNSEPNKNIKPTFDIPFQSGLEDPTQNQIQDTRLHPFKFTKHVVGFINAVKKRVEYINTTEGIINDSIGPKISLPTESVRAAVGEDATNLGAYYKNGVQIISLPDSQTVVVMETLDVLPTNKKLELYLTSFSQSGEVKKVGPITILDNTMYYLARSNFSDTIIYFNQEFSDNKLTIYLWKLTWPKPLTIKLKKTFTGTLLDIRPLSDNLIFLIGNTCSSGTEKPDTDANPAIYGPEHKILDLRNQQWVDDGTVELDDVTFQIFAHKEVVENDQKQKKTVSKFHLRDLIAVNRYNQTVITEISCSSGLYIDVLNLNNAKQQLDNSPQKNVTIQLEDTFITQQLKFAETTRPDDGVPQYIFGASDGSYAVGFEDGLDGTDTEHTKLIRVVLYHFVKNDATIQWLAKEANIGKLFDVPSIEVDVTKKFSQ